MSSISRTLITLVFLTSLGLSGCRTGTAPAGTETENENRAPERVDIRGHVVMKRYHQGQVVLEVEGRTSSPNSRYDRAFVLVLPTTQIIGIDGQPVSMNELTQGQNVAVLLRGRGEGDFVGMGIARKMWIEEFY